MVMKYQLLETLSGHSQSITGVKFSPDGRMIASCSADATINLHLLDGTLLRTFLGHEKGISDIGWSTDSKYLVSGT
jgi:COMPASS component SWD3